MKNSSIGILAIALLVGTSAFTVNATSNKNYDVNGDNTVNVVDVMEVKKAVLMGDEYDAEVTAVPSTTASYYNYTTGGSSTTRATTTYAYTTRAYTTMTTRATSTAKWSTVLDDSTIESVKDKYEVLARDYIKSNAPSLYASIKDVSVQLHNYDGLVVETSTEPTEATTTAPAYTVDSNGYTMWYATTVSAYRVAYAYDAEVTITFSKNISANEKDAFPKAYLYDDYSDTVVLCFKNGFVTNID
jgi:hypothetical protein